MYAQYAKRHTPNKCAISSVMTVGPLLPMLLPLICVAPSVLDVSTPSKYFLLCRTSLQGHMVLVDSFTVIVCVTDVEYVLRAGS